MKEREIYDNRPKGATHIQYQRYYWKHKDGESFEWNSQYSKWESSFGEPEDYANFRSLADIKRILYLEDLAKMIVDGESAEPSVIPYMFHSWLNKAKELLKG